MTLKEHLEIPSPSQGHDVVRPSHVVVRCLKANITPVYHYCEIFEIEKTDCRTQYSTINLDTQKQYNIVIAIFKAQKAHLKCDLLVIPLSYEKQTKIQCT